MNDKKKQSPILAIENILKTIEQTNRMIDINQDSPLMVRQYTHLKNRYTQDLIKLLEKYKLKLQVVEAAVE